MIKMGKKAAIDLSKTFHRVTPDGDKALTKEKGKEILRKHYEANKDKRHQVMLGQRIGKECNKSKGKC